MLTSQALSTSQAAQMAWFLALDIAQDRAQFQFPSETKRIQGGRKLLDQGKVQVIPRYGAEVESQSQAGKTYSVNGACQCQAWGFAQDRGDTSYRCAHRWSYLLYRGAIDRLTKLSMATYDDIQGFVYALPEDSGYVFMDAWQGAHRFVTAPQTANLHLHGRCAWIEDGRLRGMVPQVALDAM